MADYYVSPTGSDTNSGSINSPFLTPIKGLNVVNAGDRLILREGIYRGNSGWFPPKATADLPISVEAYPNEKVELTALSRITGWEPVDLTNGKAIYRAPMPFTMCGSNTAIAGEDFVTCNGIPVNEAQWPTPNVDLYPQKAANWATVDSGAWVTNPSTKNALVTVQIQDASLATFATDALVGSKITLLPGARWALVSGTVSGNTGDKLTCVIKSPGGSSFYTPDARSSYFLFDKKIFLSAPGSWWRDPNTNYLYIWLRDSSNPNDSIVEAKKEGRVFDFYARSHYRFKNLTFTGGALNINSASNMKFDGCDFKWYSHRLYIDMIWGWVNPAFYVSKNNIEIKNCNFSDSFGTIIGPEPQQGLIVENCVLSNTGGVTFAGTNSRFVRNTVDACPGGCFKLTHNVAGTEIAYNDFGRSGEMFTDGGIFLIERNCVGSGRIHRNFIHDGYAPSDGTKEFYGTAGFYFEFDISNLTLDHNIICRVTSPGFNLVANSGGKKLENINLYNNTCDGTVYWIPTWAGNPAYPNVRFYNNYLKAQAPNTGQHTDLQFSKNVFNIRPSYLASTGNFEATNPGFNPDYGLNTESPLLSVGRAIAGITTDPFPDIGASEGADWRAGAIVRDIDIPQLEIGSYLITGTQVVFTIASIPFGRHLGDNFQMKLGTGTEATGTIVPYSKAFGQTVWVRLSPGAWQAIGQIDTPPVLQSLSSDAGLPGTLLSLFGSDYQLGSIVFLGDRQLATSYIDVDSLGITVPVDSEVGALQLRVVNADRQTSGALSFTVLSSLTLTGSSVTVVSPGQQITLTGTGFVAGAIARFGLDIDVAVDFSSSVAIGVQVPVLSTGVTTVKVINPDAVESESLDLTVILLPTIASFSPNPIQPGQTLEILGQNFGADPYVSISGTAIIPIAYTENSLQIIVPQLGSILSAQVTVVSEVGASLPVDLIIQRPPVVQIALPTSAPVGVRIGLVGANLVAGSHIFFDGTVGVSPSFANTTATAIVPEIPSGTIEIQVVSPQNLISESISFEVLPSPAILSVLPSAAVAGAVVSIYGENFLAGIQVSLNNTLITAGVTLLSQTLVEIIIPDLPPNTYGLWIENPDGGTSGEVSFLVQGRPTIGTLSKLKALPGNIVSIAGTNFESGAVVRFDDTALPVQLTGSTALSFVVPIASPGIVDLFVRNLTGLESIAVQFEVLAIPTISSISPVAAIAETLISITGSHFKPDAEIYLDTHKVVTLWQSSSLMTMVVPADLFGTFGLKIANASDDLSSSLVNFTILRKPSISSIAPTSGQPGSTIKIFGTDFDMPTVLLSGSAIPSANNGTYLSFVLPEYPPGILSIRIRNVTDVLSEPIALVVLPPIALSSANPPTSAPKTKIELLGNYFPADSRVFFGNAEALVASVVGDRISVEVPVLPAIPTAIQVRTPAGAISTTTIPFDVLPALGVFRVVPNPAPSGTRIQVQGNGFEEGILVFIRSIAAAVTRINDSLIEAIVPEMSPGPAPVRVVLPDDDRQVVFSFAVPSVWISGVSHTIVQVGEWLEITGTGFIQPMTVVIGGVIATEVIVVSSTLLRVRVPPSLINNA